MKHEVIHKVELYKLGDGELYETLEGAQVAQRNNLIRRKIEELVTVLYMEIVDEVEVTNWVIRNKDRLLEILKD